MLAEQADMEGKGRSLLEQAHSGQCHEGPLKTERRIPKSGERVLRVPMLSKFEDQFRE